MDPVQFCPDDQTRIECILRDAFLPVWNSELYCYQQLSWQERLSQCFSKFEEEDKASTSKVSSFFASSKNIIGIALRELEDFAEKQIDLAKIAEAGTPLSRQEQDEASEKEPGVFESFLLKGEKAVRKVFKKEDDEEDEKEEKKGAAIEKSQDKEEAKDPKDNVSFAEQLMDEQEEEKKIEEERDGEESNNLGRARRLVFNTKDKVFGLFKKKDDESTQLLSQENEDNQELLSLAQLTQKDLRILYKDYGDTQVYFKPLPGQIESMGDMIAKSAGQGNLENVLEVLSEKPDNRLFQSLIVRGLAESGRWDEIEKQYIDQERP